MGGESSPGPGRVEVDRSPLDRKVQQETGLARQAVDAAKPDAPTDYSFAPTHFSSFSFSPSGVNGLTR